MRLVLLHGHYIGSRPGTESVWHVGEEREVSDETGRYLLATFPDKFRRVDAVSAALDEPPADRAIKSAPKRRGA